ncbi:MAG: 4-hydroxy-3-methylbut-2-enyl diphosphate reductase [Coraliomargaritaceae bacterium]
MESPKKCAKEDPQAAADTPSDPWVLLLFDQHYRIGCTPIPHQRWEPSAVQSEDGDESPEAAAERLSGISQTHRITSFSFNGCNYALHVGVNHSTAEASLAYHSLDELEKAFATDLNRPGPLLAAALRALNPHLHRIPYLDIGEHQYIYRFRTAKERNRQVYVDEQSQALYQSQLCSVVKAARRTRENTSGQPARLDFGPVRYILPSHFGFCLGVQNAIERAYETVAAYPDRRVFMLSELIHNPYVNEDLLARGLRYLQTDKGLPLRADGVMAVGHDDPDALWNQLTSDDIVIIPAFGATNEDKARLIRAGIPIRRHDATCMLVEKVWKAARRYAAEGYTVLIHGKSEHEETKATFSNSASHGPALMVRNRAHVEALAKIIRMDGSAKRKQFESVFAGLYSRGFDPERDLERIAVVNQTTLLSNETLHIIEYLREVLAEKYGPENVDQHLWSKGKGDTLCYATQVNQDALHSALSQEIDAALVVGGRNSSNTFQLFHVCREHLGENAHYIQSEANILSRSEIRHYSYPLHKSGGSVEQDIDRSFLPEKTGEPLTLLITGGASCPDGIIQKVIHRINGFFAPESLRPVETILAEFEAETGDP